MFSKIIVFIISFCLAILCLSNLPSIFKNIIEVFDSNFYYFLAGFTLSALVVIKFQDKITFYSTFEHELTHNIWALLFLKKPSGFHVNSDGSGLFEYYPGSKFSRIFILLAPYFFPTACFLWLPFLIICKEEYYNFYFAMMGIFLGYHFIDTFLEAKPYQTDISTNGLVYSYSVLILLYIVFNGIIFSTLYNGFDGIVDLFNFQNIFYILKQ